MKALRRRLSYHLFTWPVFAHVAAGHVSQGMIFFFCQYKARCDTSVQYLMIQLHTHNRQYFNLNETQQVLPHSPEPIRHRHVHSFFSRDPFPRVYVLSVVLLNSRRIFTKPWYLTVKIPCWRFGSGTKSPSAASSSARLKKVLRFEVRANFF